MRCKHDQRVTLIEYGTATTTHDLEHGKVMHNSDYGDYTGVIEVECRDCGFRRVYNRRRRASLPKWVQSLYDYLTTTDSFL